MSFYIVSWAISNEGPDPGTIRRTILMRLRAFTHYHDGSQGGNIALVKLPSDKRPEELFKTLRHVIRDEDKLVITKLPDNDRTYFLGAKAEEWLQKNR
jgi:hypothetical protein